MTEMWSGNLTTFVHAGCAFCHQRHLGAWQLLLLPDGPPLGPLMELALAGHPPGECTAPVIAVQLICSCPVAAPVGLLHGNVVLALWVHGAAWWGMPMHLMLHWACAAWVLGLHNN